MLDGEPAGLAKYVQPETVKGLIGLPGPSTEPVLDRLRQIYDAFAARRIRYAWEEYSDEPGRQVIRPPDQVLRYPGHGTCLDLAVTFAAACQVAGLRPVIVIVKPARPGPFHALVAVWLAAEGVDYPLGEKVYREPPADLVDEIQADLDGPPGRFAVIDVAGVCPAQPRSPVRGLGVGFGDAVRQGAEYLSVDTWAWWLGVDIGTAWRPGDVLPVPAQPLTSPLREPYLDPAGVESPLRLIRADYDVVPFQDRDELTVLDDCCQVALERPAVKVAVIHGVGGSGKTRLAIELAAQLGGQGWYAGLLRPGCGEADIAWLAAVVSPLFVVIDYAETRSEQLRWLFGALRHRADLPTVVILTARSTLWWDQLAEELANDAVPYRLVRQIALERRHGDSGRVFRAAFHAFSAAPVAAPGVTVSPRWTTLDFVLLAWLAANDHNELPQTRGELYRAAMRHEYSYWRRTYGGTDDALPERSVFHEAAVCLTLPGAADNRAGTLLGAVAELGRDGAALNRMSRTLKTCIGEPDGRLTLRPDPVADQLTVDVLNASPGLLDSLLALVNDEERIALAVSLNRAGAANEALATTQLRAAISISPQLLGPVLQVATLQGGPALTALEQLAADRGSELPADLEDRVPDHILLRGLRWRLAERRLAAVLEESKAEPEEIGALLDRVAIAAGEAGQRERGLEAARQAVDCYRTLAEARPDVFLPNLAMSLNNLSVQQSDNGDRTGALASIQEGARHYRTLADASPDVFLPNLATSLNNLSNQQSGNGDRTGALASIQEAARHYRTLADARPDVFLPNLATSLNNLSNQQSDNGDRTGALASIQEAVQIRRTLADARPDVFLPDLATSLNNLSNQQSGNGDRTGALASIQEAVQIRRTLADARPDVFLPNLATSLNNLSNQQSDNGDRTGALASIQEAVQIRRTLADARPDVFLPDLAGSLNNLSVQQSGNGDRTGALASIQEAVQIRRTLADARPDVFLPNLATSLNNLSVQQSDNGDRTGALASIQEAVQIRRTLAEARPDVFLPDLAGSLNNLSNRQSDNGDRTGALASIQEAARHYRTLADARPDVFLPDLAASLNNLSVQQSDNGDRTGALASIQEAARHYRTLADASPDVFLPNLAGSLNNLSVQQSGNGDRAGALASIQEAVQIRRILADARPDVFLPDLAGSLNNLSNRQSDNGDRTGALASIQEAVQIRRILADARPDVFLPDLAGSLNNLSNRQSGNGDRAGALASIQEAVQIRRILAEARPDVFLPDLAGSLNNLSNRQSDNGDRTGALASIQEAARHYRTLADARPDVFLPNLAGSLNNLSNRQSDNGDRTGALASIQEAVQIRRTLAEARPDVFLPDLAASLNNLSVQQSGNGDRAGALASIQEAVQIRRTLAEARPDVFLPDLATSLNNLADILLAKDETPAVSQSRAVIETLTDPLSRAELRARTAEWCLANHQPADAASLVTQGVGEARDGEPQRLGQARQALRQVATRLDGQLGSDELPPWAIAPLEDSQVDLISQWAAATTWTEEATLLHQRQPDILSPTFSDTLELLEKLYPSHPGLARIRSRLDVITSEGFDRALVGLDSGAQVIRLVSDWIATETWDDSKRYLGDHRAELYSQEAMALLADQSDSAEILSHLGILRLDQALGLDATYTVVTDPTAGEADIDRAIRTGDTELLQAIAMAAPHLLERPVTGHLIIAVLALTAEDQQAAETHAQAAADSATPLRREAITIHLRGLAAAIPEHSGAITKLIEIFAHVD